MTSKPSSIIATTSTPQQKQIEAASKRTFRQREDDPPTPIFINNIEFGGIGVDVFMDVGVVTPEALQLASEHTPEGKMPVVNFSVIHRFGMSLQSAAIMHQRLAELIQQTVANQQAQQAQAIQVAKGKSEKKG